MSLPRVDQPLALRISAEQIALLYKNAPLAYIVTFINGSILVYIQRACISPVRLSLWFILLGLITLGRTLLVYRYTHTRSPATEAYRWGQRYSIGAGLAGLVWGSAAILLFPQNDLSHQVFVAFVLAGMTAAAVGVLSIHWLASLAFVVPALLPLIIQFFLQGGEVQTAMGIMTLLFLSAILIIMRVVNRSILSTLQLNLEKDALSQQLQQDKEATDRLNVRLQVEIAEHQKTEAILRESEEKYRRTMDAALVGIYVIEKLNFQYVNPMMTQLFGYTSQEMEKLSPLDLVVTEHRDSVSTQLRQQRAGGPGAPLELRCVRKEGSHFEAMTWMRTTVYGGQQVIVGTFVDISARKGAERALQQANATLEQHVQERTAELEETNAALRDSEERLRLALQASEAGVWEWNLMTDAILWSPENFSLYGLDPTQGPPTPEDWEGTLHPEDRERLRQTVRAAGAYPEQEYRTEFRVRHPRRGLRWLLSVGRVERALDGAPQRLLGISLDITSRKQMEEVLKETDRRKDEFLAMLAHELRNPLAPIRHAVQIFRELGTEDPRLHWARELIDRQVNHLARLVDDLLDVSRLVQGRITLHWETVDLAAVIAQAREASEPLIQSRHHTLSVTLPDEPLPVRADVVRLVQVIQNLLTNAAKYTPEGGRIELEARRENDQAIIQVRDTGIGLSPEVLPHIFELFMQGERGLDRSQGGLGIGLTVVKRLVELHGGRIEARSNGPGRGSEFTVCLPLGTTPPTGHRTVAAPGQRSPGAPRRILVVDDQVDVAESLALVLELEGHQVKTALDGPTALELATEFQPDVVLLDLGLPEMDGYVVAQRLRARPETQNVLLIAVTGYGRQEDRERTQATGFDHHLVKPIDLEELGALLAADR